MGKSALLMPRCRYLIKGTMAIKVKEAFEVTVMSLIIYFSNVEIYCNFNQYDSEYIVIYYMSTCIYVCMYI